MEFAWWRLRKGETPWQWVIREVKEEFGLNYEVKRLKVIKEFKLPDELFKNIPQKTLKKYKERTATEDFIDLKKSKLKGDAI